MDKAEAFAALAIGIQSLTNEINHASEQLCLCRVNAHAVAPAAPVGLGLAKAGFKIPGEALEIAGPLPLAGVGVHAGCNLTEDFKGLDEILANSGFRSCFPVRQHHKTRPLHAGVGHCLNDLAVDPRNRFGRDHHASGPQIHEPGKFGGNRRPGMVAIPVNAQRPALAIGRRNPVGRVLREIDHLNADAVWQGVIFCGTLGKRKQDR